MATETNMYYCDKCHRTLNEKEFYRSNDLEKYPNDGIMPECKRCLTMHVDNWDPDTYLWILQEADVPYIPDEWNKLMAKYAKDKSKLTGMTIIGRYLSKMKLKQYREYRWADSAFIEELNQSKKEQAMKRQGKSAAEIAAALESDAQYIPNEVEKPDDPIPQPTAENVFTQQITQSAEELGLTEEDQINLRLKWGSTYRPEEWVKLEQLYQSMLESYDIQQAGHIDTLKFICKASLKANQLIDMGDMEGFQRAIKAYNDLMKSGNFTAAQNKTENGDYVDSVSELVAICETDGFIPRYYVDKPQDHVDRTLQDLQEYTRTLVTDEMNLGNLIENAVKLIEQDKEREATNDFDENADEDEIMEQTLFSNKAETYIQDEDYNEFNAMIDDLEAQDNKLLETALEGEES